MIGQCNYFGFSFTTLNFVNHSIPKNNLACGDRDPFGQHQMITTSGHKNVFLPRQKYT